MDKNDFKNENGYAVALVFGGKGYEHSVSRLGAANFLKTANDLGIKVLSVYIDKSGDFFVYDGEISYIAKTSQPLPKGNLKATFPVRLHGKCGFLYGENIISVRRVIPLLHGDYGEDGIIQGLFEAASIACFGADTLTGAITSDKAYSKIIASYYGVPTLPFLTFENVRSSADEAEKLASERFGYPLFVKPSGLGSSIGASAANCKSEFTNSIKNAFSIAKKVIVEPALSNKREIECAYYNIGEKEIISSPGEVLTGSRFYDYDLKYSEENAVSAIPNATLTEEEKKTVMEYTKILSRAFSVRHIARFDFFLTPQGEIYFNEVNTLPGVTDLSLYSMMLEFEGVDFRAFVSALCLSQW